MCPTVVPVISLLVALMHTADGKTHPAINRVYIENRNQNVTNVLLTAGLAEDCATQYPAKSCGDTEWQWLSDGRCMKVISEALSNDDAQVTPTHIHVA